MGSFCVTQSNQTHQLTDSTQPNQLQVETFGPNPTQPNPIQLTNVTAWCSQILSNRALNALTQSFRIFSTFVVVDQTRPTKN